MKKLVSLDWVTVHARPIGEHINYAKHGAEGFTIKQMERGTRTCRIWEEAWVGERRVATISREPYSAVMDEKMILIKFDNWMLYRGDFFEEMKRILAEWDLQFVGYSRVDFALDFQELDNGNEPIQIIRDFLAHKCLKIGKGVGQTFFKYHYSFEPMYLRFGSGTSDICAYTYNKTAELAAKEDKPWIRETWKECEADPERDVWRLEFSVKASAVKFLDDDTAEILDTHNIDFINPDNLRHIYSALLGRYWQFCDADHPDKNKARRPRLDIMSLDKTPFRIFIQNNEMGSNRTEKMIIKKIKMLYDEMRDVGHDNLREMEITQENIIQNHGLQDWVKQRGYSCVDLPLHKPPANDTAFARSDIKDKAEKRKAELSRAASLRKRSNSQEKGSDDMGRAGGDQESCVVELTGASDTGAGYPF